MTRSSHNLHVIQLATIHLRQGCYPRVLQTTQNECCRHIYKSKHNAIMKVRIANAFILSPRTGASLKEIRYAEAWVNGEATLQSEP